MVVVVCDGFDGLMAVYRFAEAATSSREYCFGLPSRCAALRHTPLCTLHVLLDTSYACVRACRSGALSCRGVVCAVHSALCLSVSFPILFLLLLVVVAVSSFIMIVGFIYSTVKQARRCGCTAVAAASFCTCLMFCLCPRSPPLPHPRWPCRWRSLR